MAMYTTKTRRKQKKSFTKYAVLGLVLLAAAAAVFFYTQRDTTKSVPVSDPNFTDGTERDPSPTKGDSSEGGIIDTSDRTPAPSGDTASASVSASGKTTVYQPTSNSVLTSGSTISGKTSNNNISYRLIDDKTGVIGTGSLKVVNGRFSGRFEFNSSGAEGRLDIFSTLSNGKEIDVVEIPVRFK